MQRRRGLHDQTHCDGQRIHKSQGVRCRRECSKPLVKVGRSIPLFLKVSIRRMAVHFSDLETT